MRVLVCASQGVMAFAGVGRGPQGAPGSLGGWELGPVSAVEHLSLQWLAVVQVEGGTCSQSALCCFV